MFKAGVNFTIPTDGSIKIIDGGPFFTDFNGNVSSSLYVINLPEGITKIIDAAYSSSIMTVRVPHSLQFMEPGAFRGGGLKNIIYAGTTQEWIAITASQVWYSNLQVGCTDGTLHFDTDHWVRE